MIHLRKLVTSGARAGFWYTINNYIIDVNGKLKKTRERINCSETAMRVHMENMHHEIDNGNNEWEVISSDEFQELIRKYKKPQVILRRKKQD